MIVTYEDMPLTDPHVFTLEVRSLGGRDIRSSDFDSNRPLRFNVGSELKAWLDIKAKTGAVAGYSQKIELSPCLIRKGNVFKVIALTEGRASVFCDNPLVDIQVTEHAVPNSVLRVGILNASWQGALILAAAWFIPAVLTYLELVAVRRSALAMALFYGLYVVYPIVLYAAINRLLRIFERRDGDAADDW